MIKLLLFYSSSLLLSFFLGVSYERSMAKSTNIPTIHEQYVQVDTPQARQVQTLEKYFLKKHSPMVTQSAYLVGLAHREHLDYLLIPSISGVESGFCKAYIKSTHNCLGWDSGLVHFNSFEAAEDTIAHAISQGKSYRIYQSTGNIYDLARVYNGGNYREWADKIQRFSNEIQYEGR